MPVPFVERRGPDRPKNGDTRRCPTCGLGTIEFNERYRLVDGITQPAWVCDSAACGHRQSVRRNPVEPPPGARRKRARRRAD